MTFQNLLYIINFVFFFLFCSFGSPGRGLKGSWLSSIVHVAILNLFAEAARYALQKDQESKSRKKITQSNKFI